MKKIQIVDGFGIGKQMNNYSYSYYNQYTLIILLFKLKVIKGIDCKFSYTIKPIQVLGNYDVVDYD